MRKTIYEVPLVEVLSVKTEGALLYGSVETMNTIVGSWEEDDE